MIEDKLDLTYYSGQDLYSDGDIEDELLQIVKNNDNYEEILKNDDRWPILYHLSDVRKNLLGWYDFGKSSHVLEIGAGCGAVTGSICKTAGQVTCVELSKRRSLINVNRNKGYDNFNVVVGNFEDIKLDVQFDYVTLIGVLEYSPSYVGGDAPFSTMLNKINNLLKTGGKVVIAIENKFGLKYFAGATEDHTGNVYDGINSYKKVNNVKTFTKVELTKLLENTGFDNLKYYYPLPDYKMPTVVYSDDHLPKPGELRNISYVFDRDRNQIFDENSVYDQLCADGKFDYFANSFLVFAEKK